MSWMKNQKDHCFEVSFSPIRHNNNEPCFNWIVTCNEKWILYDDQWWAALWLDQETPKHLPQPNLHQKKVVVTGGLLLVWSTTAFWIPAKPLQLRSMFSQSMRCMKNCKAYSQHCSTERFQFFSPIPDCTNTSKVEQTFVCSTNKTKLWSFASSAISNWLPLLQASRQLFAGKCFHNEQEAENAFQEFIESWSTDFYATGIKRLISYWQKYVDCNYSYFD